MYGIVAPFPQSEALQPDPDRRAEFMLHEMCRDGAGPASDVGFDAFEERAKLIRLSKAGATDLREIDDNDGGN